MTIILSDKECKAKKRHICDECLNDINLGELYHKQCNIFEGDFGVWKSHIDCRKMALYLNRNGYDGEWMPIHDHSQDQIIHAKTVIFRSETR